MVLIQRLTLVNDDVHTHTTGSSQVMRSSCTAVDTPPPPPLIFFSPVNQWRGLHWRVAPGRREWKHFWNNASDKMVFLPINQIPQFPRECTTNQWTHLFLQTKSTEKYKPRAPQTTSSPPTPKPSRNYQKLWTKAATRVNLILYAMRAVALNHCRK